MTETFAGKTVLVTGGSRGLGEATALAFASRGADVAISYVASHNKATTLVDRLRNLGSNAIAIEADQADDEAISKMMSTVADHFGHLDILINNARLTVAGRIDDPEVDHKMMDYFWAVTLKGVMRTTREAARLLRNHGRIVSIGSNMGHRVGMAGFSDNAASKAALDGFTKGTARDLAPRNITVNAVHAGMMQTDMTRGKEKAVRRVLDGLCFPRFGLLEEIVAPILFLASPAASYITGSTIDADGGFLA